MLQCVAVCCSVLQCVAVCCSVLKGVAGCCRVLQGATHTPETKDWSQHIALHFKAGCCSVLQCVAVCCTLNMLQTHLQRRTKDSKYFYILLQCVAV